MASGLQIFDANARAVFDSANAGATLYDVVQLASSSGSGSRGYPGLTGRTIYFVRIAMTDGSGPDNQLHTISVSYPGGTPTVSWTKVTATSKPAHILILVK